MSEITPAAATAVVSMTFTVSGFPSLTKVWGKSHFVPERVKVSMVNGKLSAVSVAGGKLLSSGKASEKVILDNRYWSRRDAPDWLWELAEKALFECAKAGLFETQRVEWS